MSASNNPITFQQNVTTSGTPVQLTDFNVGSNDNKNSVIIKAKVTNAGFITVGYSSSTALNSGTNHFKLAAGEAVSIGVENTRQVWIDSTISGEGVEVLIG